MVKVPLPAPLPMPLIVPHNKMAWFFRYVIMRSYLNYFLLSAITMKPKTALKNKAYLKNYRHIKKQENIIIRKNFKIQQ